MDIGNGRNAVYGHLAEGPVPWSEITPMDQRLRFIVDVGRSDETFAALCARYGIAPKTGYKWLARSAEAGRRPRRHGDGAGNRWSTLHWLRPRFCCKAGQVGLDRCTRLGPLWQHHANVRPQCV